MFVVLSGRSERVVDIVWSWFSWLSAPVARFGAGLVVAVLSVLCGLVAGWATVPVYLAAMAGVAFAIGPFNQIYRLARFARLWHAEHLPGAAPAPGRRRFAITVVAQAFLMALGVAGCWLYLHRGWDLIPLVYSWSPWLPLLIPVGPLLLTEWVVRRQIRAEIRRQVYDLVTAHGSTLGDTP